MVWLSSSGLLPALLAAGPQRFVLRGADSVSAMHR
jgi:hypothetical protein